MIYRQVIRDWGFLHLDHPAYSFLKSHLHCVCYPGSDSFKTAMEAWLEGQT